VRGGGVVVSVVRSPIGSLLLLLLLLLVEQILPIDFVLGRNLTNIYQDFVAKGRHEFLVSGVSRILSEFLARLRKNGIIPRLMREVLWKRRPPRNVSVDYRLLLLLVAVMMAKLLLLFLVMMLLMHRLGIARVLMIMMLMRFPALRKVVLLLLLRVP
jgi:hypothetical protein